ncbi:MAG: heme ABC transporter ATP-binding protein [Cytophagales bacterium]|nr:heme ABC transporter ATP-binding protein [Cytophagales bacterium]
MIEAKGITYLSTSKRPIIQDVSFSAQRGEMVIIVGPNGAGKSTLLKNLAGALSPTQGEIFIDEKNIKDYLSAELAKKRAVLSQHYNLSADFLVKDIVMMGRYPHFEGIPSEQDYDIVSYNLELTGTKHLEERSIKSLSGGEQQRVHLARVLSQVTQNQDESSILFLDEPISSLDIHYQFAILEVAHQKSQEGMTVIAVLHDLNLASRFADRLVIIKDGKKYADGISSETLKPELLSDVYNIPIEVIQHNHDNFIFPKGISHKKEVLI